MRLTAFTLTHATPEGYSARAASALLLLAGVKDVLVNAPDQICSVLYDEQCIAPPQLLRALATAGFASEPLEATTCCGACS